MEVSRITFTKETKEKMRKRLSNREKGKLRYDRIKELEDQGLLVKASNRKDIARMGGYTSQQNKQGASWVSNLIKSGYLTETLLGRSSNGKKLFEYHMTDKTPSYGRRKTTEQAEDKPRVRENSLSTHPQGLDNSDMLSKTKRRVEQAPIKIEITRGDISIKVEIDGYEQANKLITAILKGD